jgi:S-(hydroxymethyl)glutathione dehydrogenase / alcohol dehydrogenase
MVVEQLRGQNQVPTQSRAAVAFEPGAPLKIVDLEVADPRHNEILVHFEATGICHSDLNFISGAFAHKFPAVFGHEGIGRVVAVGTDVGTFREGDRVMPYLLPHCGVCAYCKSGKTNHCVEFQRNFLKPEDTPFSIDGQRVASFFGIATFSEYSVVRQDQLVKVSNSAPAVPTCCVGCGVATGFEGQK